MIILLAFSLAPQIVIAQNDLASLSDGPLAVELSDQVPPPFLEGLELIWDNGPFVNSPGTGVGGRDESVLQNVSLGMSTLGFDNSVSTGWRVADDFSPQDLPSVGHLHVSAYVVFAYQTGAGPSNSTIDEFNLCVWSGEPGNGGVPYWGDCDSDQMDSSMDTEILRVTEETTGQSDERAVYAIEANYPTYNEDHVTGRFWLDWQVSGTLATGPYTPPITVTGECETGNGIQSFDGGQTWQPAIDEATGCRQGFPFQLYG